MEIHPHLSFADNVILALQDLGAVRFGSREWGGAREDSDYDYVLPLKYAQELKTEIAMQLPRDATVCITDNDYYISGYYIQEVMGKTINITGCKLEEFHAWKTASNMMKVADCGNMTKKNRQTLFETVFAILRRALVNNHKEDYIF